MIGDDGQHIEIECKTGSGKLTEAQEGVRLALRSAGADHWVVRSVDDLVECLKEVDLWN
jgi:hypothetical protein